MFSSREWIGGLVILYPRLKTVVREYVFSLDEIPTGYQSGFSAVCEMQMEESTQELGGSLISVLFK